MHLKKKESNMESSPTTHKKQETKQETIIIFKRLVPLYLRHPQRPSATSLCLFCLCASSIEAGAFCGTDGSGLRWLAAQESGPENLRKMDSTKVKIPKVPKNAHSKTHQRQFTQRKMYSKKTSLITKLAAFLPHSHLQVADCQARQHLAMSHLRLGRAAAIMLQLWKVLSTFQHISNLPTIHCAQITKRFERCQLHKKHAKKHAKNAHATGCEKLQNPR